MGYGVHRFVEDIDENLLCGICSAVLEDPVLTPCGHSFCHGCLSTWLARPGPGSCPQCRGRVALGSTTPILSLRSLIHALEIHCEHVERGCVVTVKLECLPSHVEVCDFVPMECAGCGSFINRSAMAEHHVQCDAITTLFSDLSPQAPATDLAYRITGLEIQVNKIKLELDSAKEQNSKLEEELSRTRHDLELKRSQLQEQQFVDFDAQYEYGYAPSSIVRLACLIARCLLKMPAYIDSDKVYVSIQRCYDNYGRRGTEQELDVLMLLATANASNWFNNQQKLNIQCWLQCLNRYRQYKHDKYKLGSSFT